MDNKINLNLYGHDEAEQEVLKSYNHNNLHHAWLISGPKGIGKATLAYRISKFLFKNGASSPEEEGGLLGGMIENIEIDSLDIDTESNIHSRFNAGTITDLKIVEPDIEAGKSEITVDMIRDVNHFLSQTTAEFDWKIVVIDSADNMNRNAANALLKSLEEPPKNTVLFLISHSPRKLLPTIRSRCRSLQLKPLSEDNINRILDDVEIDENKKLIDFASKMAEGSAGMAVELCDKDMLKLYEAIIDLLRNDNLDTIAIYKFAEKFSKKDSLLLWKNMNYIIMWILAEIVNFSLTGVSNNVCSEDEEEIKKAILARKSIEDITIIWNQVMKIISESDNLKLDKNMTAVNLLSKL